MAATVPICSEASRGALPRVPTTTSAGATAPTPSSRAWAPTRSTGDRHRHPQPERVRRRRRGRCHERGRKRHDHGRGGRRLLRDRERHRDPNDDDIGMLWNGIATLIQAATATTSSPPATATPSTPPKAAPAPTPASTTATATRRSAAERVGPPAVPRELGLQLLPGREPVLGPRYRDGGHRGGDAEGEPDADVARGHPVFTLLRAGMTEPEAAEMLRNFMIHRLYAPLTERLGSDNPELRAGQAVAQIIGWGWAATCSSSRGWRARSRPEVIDWLAPVLQGYLTGKLVELCSPPGSRSWPPPSRRSTSPILARWPAMRS